MKKGVILAALIVLAFPAILATVVVNENSIEADYISGENLRGTLNLEIIEEELDSTLSSDKGHQISLEELLDKNSATYTCQVPDCSNEYIASSELSGGQLQLESEEKSYAGFVFQGSDIEINSISFDLESDFDKSAQPPLSLNFFERLQWNFNEFSEEFSTKVSGCYSSQIGSPGSLIGIEGYCEKIPVSTTAAIKMEAQVTSIDDDKELIMELYEKSGTSTGGSPIKSCTYNPGQGEVGCTVSAGDGEVFASEDYYACVRASTQTNYKIYDEADSENCGFLFSRGPLDSIKDFAIFLSFAKYEDASNLDSSKIDFDELAVAADDLINTKYNRDCSEECVLPIEVQGVDQALIFSNISIYYQDSGGILKKEKINEIVKNPPLVNFSGSLEMSHAEFEVTEGGPLSIFLNEEKITETRISLASPIAITSMSPLDPPAGSPIEFTAILSYAGSPVTMDYNWDFGDGETVTTKTNKVTHTYAEIKDYVMTLKIVSSSGLSSDKAFRIFAKDPSVAINETLREKKEALENIADKIKNVPMEHKSSLEKALELKELQSKITNLEKELGLSSGIDDLARLGSEIYGLNIPLKLDVTASSNIPLVNEVYAIDASPVATAEGVQKKNLDNYREEILKWQTSNIIAKLSSVSYSTELFDGETQPLLRSYLLNVRSRSSQDSFIVINHNSREVFFKGSVDSTTAEGYSVIPLEAMEQKTLEFYVLDLEEVPVFISPKLSNVVIEGDIDTTCNFNLVCEEDLGESPSTCRTDCKPTIQAGFYLIAAVIFLLIFYTALQIWYKRNYENYLFGNKKHLYNILMYVTNAKARGMSSGQISKNLQKHGWSKERVRYVIRKANGQGNGLYEIIPVDKIMSVFRKKSAKKDIERREQGRLRNPPRESSSRNQGNFQQRSRRY
jgi:PKD repeat protein